VLVGALVGLSISAVGAFATFRLAESYLSRQRETTALTQTVATGRLLVDNLAEGLEPARAILDVPFGPIGGRALLYTNEQWYVSSGGISERDLPRDYVSELLAGWAVQQKAQFTANPVVITGLPVLLPDDPGAAFVIVLPLSELDRTLGLIGTSLLIGVFMATLLGGAVGYYLSRRVMEPLRAVSMAATKLSSGDLSFRVSPPTEPDLALIAESFNSMLDSLQERIRREKRFAAHVSHELRSPLTVLRGSLELIEANKDSLGPEGRLGVEMMAERLDNFEQMLLDLLEIARYESDNFEVDLTGVEVDPLIRSIFERLGVDSGVLAIDPSARHLATLVDVRRLHHVLSNLVQNADRYAGGVTRVVVKVDQEERVVRIHVDDAGHGIRVEDRQVILEPFMRGRNVRGVDGAGLGLAIVTHHLEAMGGCLVVGDNPNGGARFSVVLPIVVHAQDQVS
jgi:signal transduction histidine kinase